MSLPDLWPRYGCTWRTKTASAPSFVGDSGVDGGFMLPGWLGTSHFLENSHFEHKNVGVEDDFPVQFGVFLGSMIIFRGVF